MRTGRTEPPRRRVRLLPPEGALAPWGGPAALGARQRGFTYLWLLFALALGGVGLAALGELESTRQQREREAELHFRGNAIAAALARYADATPIGHLPLPRQLEDLLNDNRQPRSQRHLRQLYADPFTGKADWEPVWGLALPRYAAETPPEAEPVRGIVGLRSRSTRPVMASPGAQRKAVARDWVFRADAQRPATAAAAGSDS